MTAGAGEGRGRHRVPASTDAIVRAIRECEYARLCAIETLEATRDCVRVTMDVAGKRNGFGSPHGGAIFALADQAFGLAANLDGLASVALSAQINYLAVARGGRLEAVARRVDETGLLSIYEVSVFDGDRCIALFRGVGHKIDDVPPAAGDGTSRN
ncbi:MAG: hotdog fold thioesterase [Methanomicrobiaceae archaeon]|nr:hotdog fold thioesterase [Methanomicrobiaceae archaeon]